MLYTVAVLAGVLASANAFTLSKSSFRLGTSLKASDPWFPNAVSTTEVSLEELKYDCIHGTCPVLTTE
jgi:hypothetical protein